MQSLGHSVPTPRVTHHPSGTTPLTVVPLALGLGLRLSLPVWDHTVHLIGCCLVCQPSYTGLEPPDPRVHPGTGTGTCHTQHNALGTGTCCSSTPLGRSLDWESEDGILGTILSHCRTLATFCSIHQMRSVHFSLTCHQSCLAHTCPFCPPLTHRKR